MRKGNSIEMDPETALAVEREQLAALSADAARELAAEEAIQQACKTFRDAMSAYIATFPAGLDPCDPDNALLDALQFSMDLRAASIRGLRERLKRRRVTARRAAGRRLA